MSMRDGFNEESVLDLAGDATVVDLVDRLLDRGVVLAAEITLAVADVDLVHVSLRALLGTSDRALRMSADPSRDREPATLTTEGLTGSRAPLPRHG